MYAIKIIPNKRKMDDWFLYRDPDELVVQCWNEKEDAENFMKRLNYDLCEITEDIPESAIRDSYIRAPPDAHTFTNGCLFFIQ